MSSYTLKVSKLLLLAVSLCLVLNVRKILLQERNLDHSEPRNASQWAMGLKNQGNCYLC